MTASAALLALALTLPGLSCAASPKEPAIQFKGGVGNSADDAIRIVGAKTIMEGVEAENRWLGERYPGYRKRGQNLVGTLDGSDRYDLIDIRTADGKNLTIWFDIGDYKGTRLE
jgi:hypothetical protein